MPTDTRRESVWLKSSRSFRCLSRITTGRSKAEMLLQPIIERELRVQARNRGTYWLRSLAALTAGAILITTLFVDQSAAIFRGTGRGPWVFALLHTGISLFLAAICPLLCFDTLARERREGTLGILLLTSLRPRTIVIGKLAVHLIRAFGLWLSIVPVLTVPLLLGGVGPSDLTFALVIELGIVLGSLAAALIASSVAAQPGIAMAAAMLLTLFVGESLAIASFLGLLPTLIANPTCDFAKHWIITATFGPWGIGTGLLHNGFSGQLGSGPRWLATGLWTSLAVVFVSSWAWIFVAVSFAVAQVRRLNRVKERTAAQEARHRFWFKPLFAQRSRRTRESSLRRHPILWLYTHRPKSALRRWGWCAATIAGWGLVFWMGYDQREVAPIVVGTPVVLALALGLTAATGFRRELEEGSLELLLMTPISPGSILRAQLRGLWRDFLPSFILATGLAALWGLQADGSQDELTLFLLGCWTSFLAIPAIGSRLAVRRVSPVVGWMWTLGIGAAVPLVFGFLAAGLFELPEEKESRLLWIFFGSFAAYQLALGAFCGWCTTTDLVTRRFQLKPFQRATR